MFSFLFLKNLHLHVHILYVHKSNFRPILKKPLIFREFILFLYDYDVFLRKKYQWNTVQCGKMKITEIYYHKKFVNSTYLLKKFLNSWLHEIFFDENYFWVLMYSSFHTVHNLWQWHVVFSEIYVKVHSKLDLIFSQKNS